VLLCLLLLLPGAAAAQDIGALGRRLAAEYRQSGPAPMTLLPGELTRGYRGDKVIALTFDACSGRRNSYNAALIDYLRAEKIPATLFVTGSWADKFPERLRELGADPLFEIENHGWRHRACTYAGLKLYGGVTPVSRVEDMVKEIELGARRIEELTGRRPVFYRPAGAYTDSVCAWTAQRLGMEIVTFSLLSGDSEPRVPAAVIKRNILRRAAPGAVVLMHFNRPEWHELQALREAVPELRRQGYAFVRLEELSLGGY
jgi:peptidoglycan/xylan/chitin deacetylase (PgdA/CDA1 family)